LEDIAGASGGLGSNSLEVAEEVSSFFQVGDVTDIPRQMGVWDGLRSIADDSVNHINDIATDHTTSDFVSSSTTSHKLVKEGLSSFLQLGEHVEESTAEMSESVPLPHAGNKIRALHSVYVVFRMFLWSPVIALTDIFWQYCLGKLWFLNLGNNG